MAPTRLAEVYRLLSARIPLHRFRAELEAIFQGDRSGADITDVQLSRGPWKKLADEILPMRRYLTYRAIEVGEVQFQLNNMVPDAFLWLEGAVDPVGMEITVSCGRERYHVAQELVSTGTGRGFIGMTDDQETASFKKRIATPRVMYSTAQALDATKRGVLQSLEKKSSTKYQGHHLLIQTHLRSLSFERWEAIRGELAAAAAESPFVEIHVVGDGDNGPCGFRIK